MRGTKKTKHESGACNAVLCFPFSEEMLCRSDKNCRPSSINAVFVYELFRASCFGRKPATSFLFRGSQRTREPLKNDSARNFLQGFLLSVELLHVTVQICKILECCVATFKLHLCINPNVGNIGTKVGIGIDQYEHNQYFLYYLGLVIVLVYIEYDPTGLPINLEKKSYCGCFFVVPCLMK